MKTHHEILHGISLQKILEKLVEKHWFKELNIKLRMNCFFSNPSIKSSLKFLRQNPWARGKVEELYIETILEWEE